MLFSILFEFITLTLLDEQYKFCISLLCSFLRFLVPSFLFGTNIFLSALFSEAHVLRSSKNNEYRNQPEQNT
jgi:hypothetical protein